MQDWGPRIEWSTTRPPQAPSENEVHIWRVVAPHDATVLLNCLSESERARANCFQTPAGREEYVFAHGSLRHILGYYMCAAPQAIKFVQNSHGKPKIASSRDCQLRFSLSHSAGLILHAVTLNDELGIDVELIRSELDPDDLKHTVFTQTEQDSISRALAGPDRQRTFFQAWTRKEALFKGIGEGLSDGVKDIQIHSCDSKLIVSVDTDPSLNLPWSVTDLNISEHFAAALAVNRKTFTLRFNDFSSLVC